MAFQGHRSLGRWRVKGTVVTVRGKAAHFADEVEAGWEQARSLLSGLPERADQPDTGFMILHVGLAGVSLLVAWWEPGGTLLWRDFHASLDDPTRFGESRQTSASVWDIAVLAHERDAWMRHVLANPAGPDLDAYLADGMAATL